MQKKLSKDIVKRYNIKLSVQNWNMAQIWISSSSKHPGFSNSMYAARLFLKRRAAWCRKCFNSSSFAHFHVFIWYDYFLFKKLFLKAFAIRYRQASSLFVRPMILKLTPSLLVSFLFGIIKIFIRRVSITDKIMIIISIWHYERSIRNIFEKRFFFLVR